MARTVRKHEAVMARNMLSRLTCKTSTAVTAINVVLAWSMANVVAVTTVLVLHVGE